MRVMQASKGKIFGSPSRIRDIAKIGSQVILARCQSQVGRASPEPAREDKKRDFAVDVGIDLRETIRYYGSPTNVLMAREQAPLSKG